jgi:two-component system, NarL family, sensor kinase
VKAAGRQRSVPRAPARSMAGLCARLAEAEETLRAIRKGEVDAVVVAGHQGTRVFTLEGSEHAYRVLIESMSEGALTLTADKTILYANRCFAGMVKRPLEQVVGSSLSRFLSEKDRVRVRRILDRAHPDGSAMQLLLQARDGSSRPVQASIRSLPKDGSGTACFGVVLTDMTEARRNEDTLRALSRRVVHAQETERGRVALELHDNITQLLCAILFRTQSLTTGLSARDGRSKREVLKIRTMLVTAAEEVERISRHLRPSTMDQLGLVAVVRSTLAEFSARTRVPVRLARVKPAARLPADTELALFRILQEALQNIEKHARASHVTVSLSRRGALIQLRVRDDGIGFDPERRAGAGSTRVGLGLLGMRERATDAGGTFDLRSAHRAGTEIDVRLPVPSPAVAAAPNGRHVTTP